MADTKQPFDDEELNEDEFGDFDEVFNFDDDDESSFQFDESDVTTDDDAESQSEYEYAGDDAFTEAEELAPANASGLSGIIARLKNEEPKQLIKYGIGAAIVLLLVVGGLIKLVMPGAAPVKTAATAQNAFLNQPGNVGSPPTFTSPAPAVINQSDSATPIEATQGSTLGNMTPTSAVPVPAEAMPVSVPAQPTVATPVVVDSTQMQQAEGQNNDLNKHFSQLDNQVNQLNQQLAANADMNESNQAQIASLIKSIDSMQSQMAKLNNALQAIVTATSQAGHGQSGYVSTTIVTGTNLQSAPDYYVQAIIPGRAWLKNSNGQIITVAPGDAVPGYGTVSTIDSQSGVVTTSTGTKIVFGIDEG